MRLSYVKLRSSQNQVEVEVEIQVGGKNSNLKLGSSWSWVQVEVSLGIDEVKFGGGVLLLRWYQDILWREEDAPFIFVKAGCM